MSFINTVETVGDKALADSIIDRSITELNCNITTSIRQYAFRACAALEKVSFPSVTSIALGAFWQCTALTRAEFESTVAFANNAFYGCTALTALILRNTEAVSTITGTPFAGSAIASGTGYIYVPAALVDTYKANWTAYASQIRAIEDYPGIADPYSWTGVFTNIDNGSYASVYKVGDLIPLDLGTEGLVNMQIVAFDTDDLADGSGKAPISWVSEGLLKTYCRMNPAVVANDDGTYQEGTGGIGGWEKSEMRAYLNDTIMPLIPEDVRGMIKVVKKYSDSLDTSVAVINDAETEDAIWLPSYREIFGGTTVETAGAEYTGWFNGVERRIKARAGGSAQYWYLRSTETYRTYFRCVTSAGYNQTTASTMIYGVALGFCT